MLENPPGNSELGSHVSGPAGSAGHQTATPRVRAVARNLNKRATLGRMNALNSLRLCGFLEGLSFLALLFVAMPLKYWFGMPLAVRIVGSLHGGLFVLFVAVLVYVASERRWPLQRSALAFGASLLPFGTFFLDRALKRELRASLSA